MWAPNPLIWVHATGLQVSAGAAYPALAVQGLRGEGRQRPGLLGRVLQLAPDCLYFLFLFEEFFLFKPPWSKQAPGCSHSPAWLSPKNPPADPAFGRGFNHPDPCAGPKDLIVLKHSSYRQIFQCPLSLVSDLHICWNTVDCLLCSSDQLGVSLVLRGSRLCSHLSRYHLPQANLEHFCPLSD